MAVWAVHPNEPSGFHGRKAILNHASALVTTCPLHVNWHLRTLSITSPIIICLAEKLSDCWVLMASVIAMNTSRKCQTTLWEYRSHSGTYLMLQKFPAVKFCKKWWTNLQNSNHMKKAFLVFVVVVMLSQVCYTVTTMQMWWWSEDFLCLVCVLYLPRLHACMLATAFCRSNEHTVHSYLFLRILSRIVRC